MMLFLLKYPFTNANAMLQTEKMKNKMNAKS